VLARCGKYSAAVSLSSAAVSVPLIDCMLKIVLKMGDSDNTVQMSLVVSNNSFSLVRITKIKSTPHHGWRTHQSRKGKEWHHVSGAYFTRKVCVE
jgi:hypothetical protein